jgi:hypothetical protein
MSSPSIAICPSPIEPETIRSEVIGDFQEPNGAVFLSLISVTFTLKPKLRDDDAPRVALIRAEKPV